MESSFAALTGSGPDVIGAVLGVSEALRAGKGFVFNSCTFAIALEEDPPQGTSAPAPAPAASAASPPTARPAQGATARPPATAAATSTPANITERSGPILFEVTSGSVGEGGPSSVVRLGLRQITGPTQVFGVVELLHLDEEFDSGLDSVAIELAVPEVAPAPKTALLAIKGFANPGGVGYAHFGATVVVSIGSGPSPRLATKTLFVSQAPPPQGGAGIFGQMVRVSDGGDRVRVHMERTPLFSR